jgi:hypothetical protein
MWTCCEHGGLYLEWGIIFFSLVSTVSASFLNRLILFSLLCSVVVPQTWFVKQRKQEHGYFWSFPKKDDSVRTETTPLQTPIVITLELNNMKSD